MTRSHTEEFPLGPALAFLQRLWRLNHALERLSGRMEKMFGVTAQQRLLIRCVGAYPGMTAGHLANVLNVDPGTVSAALRRLEQKKLIERRRDPVDSRRVALGLTLLGRALDTPAVGTVEAAVAELLASTPAGDLQVLTAALERLTALVDGKLTS
ncbi:MAG TPA: MarR family winged helix-turn-helix transcriptional regulator [Polyangiaceae bacterium]|nr:MarR family winged helix-turn-helix transcriptional regulator [Polyangiaceae bacterium]